MADNPELKSNKTDESYMEKKRLKSLVAAVGGAAWWGFRCAELCYVHVEHVKGRNE